MTPADLLLFGPEAACLVLALVLFVCAVTSVRAATAWAIALIGSLAVCAVAIAALATRGEPFSPGIYRADFFSQSVKLVLAAGLAVTVALSRRPQTLRPAGWTELPMFLALSTAGMMMMASALELLTLYVALELSAYPIYILAALARTRRTGSEAAAKYMLQGMAASAVTLYGISFLFGSVGSTRLHSLAQALPLVSQQPAFWLGMALTLVGFLFKLAAFPFHFWAPDTYQAAPHQVVMFLATSSKVAAVALLARLTSLLIGPGGMADAPALHTMLLWMCVLAMTVGNLAAIAQKDLKRLLGYSAVAHAGYLLIGLQTFSEAGLASALFYAVGYFAMGLLCFLVVCEVGGKREFVPMEVLAGLHRRSPLLALALLIGVFGLTGLPPTVGFIGKWFLFSAALKEGQFWLVLVAAGNSAVALYYYMLIIREAYLVAPATEERLEGGLPATVLAVVIGAAIVWMGAAPDTVWTMAESAVQTLLRGA